MKDFPMGSFTIGNLFHPQVPSHLPCHTFFQLHTCSMRWSQISPVCVFTGPSSELLVACSIIKTVVGRSLEILADQHFKFSFFWSPSVIIAYLFGRDSVFRFCALNSKLSNSVCTAVGENTFALKKHNSCRCRKTLGEGSRPVIPVL